MVLYPHAMRTNRQNIQVVRQSGSSCGYHAMLNSIISIQGIDENQANQLINAKFAQANGTWRAPMIQNRKKALVKNYIEKLIHKCMLLNTKEEQAVWNTAKAEWNATTTGSFGWFYSIFNSPPQKPLRKLNADERRALGRIANAYAHAFVLNENLNILQENPANLENQLQEIIRKDRPNIPQEEVLNISQCIRTIDLTELPTEIAHATTLVGHAKGCAKGSNLETDIDIGDNLNTAELETLKTLVLQEYGIDYDAITIIDDTSLLNTEAYQDILAPAKQQMLENNCRHSFVIRTSNNDTYAEQIKGQQLRKTINKVEDTIKKTIQEIGVLQATLDSTTANDDQKKQTQTATLQEKRTSLIQHLAEKQQAEKDERTVAQKMASNQQSTHWIMGGVNRVDGQNTYSAKDSMGGDYTNQHNFLQLIEALEQPYIQQPIEIIEQPNNQNGIDDNLIFDI